MARGRFISKTLGRSKRYNRLPDHFTKLVYIHALTTADEQGRIIADAVDLYADHFVLDPEATFDRIEAALQALHDVGLLHLYEVNGKRYAVFAEFHTHNEIRRNTEGNPVREGRSRLPPPPDPAPFSRTPSAETAQAPRSGSAEPVPEVEVEVEVEDQVEVEVEESVGGLAMPNGAEPTTVGAFQHAKVGSKQEREHVERVAAAYNDHRGELPAVRAINTTRHSKVARAIRDVGSVEDAAAAMAVAAAEVAGDDFWKRKGYGFDNLLANDRFIQKAETAMNRGTTDRGRAEKDRMLAALKGRS